MKYCILLTVLIFITFITPVSAQMSGYNLLNMNGNKYLIVDYDMSYQTFMNMEDFRCEYSLENGELVLDSILVDEYDEAKSSGLTVGMKADYTGNLTLSLIVDNEKQIYKILKVGGVYIDEYDSELSAVTIVNGVQSNVFCYGNIGQVCNEQTGQLSFDVWSDAYNVKLYSEGVELKNFVEDEIYGNRLVVLPVGHYTLTVEGYSEAIERYELNIRPDERTEIYLNGYTFDPEYLNGYGTELPETGVFILDLLYSNTKMLSLNNLDAPSSFHADIRLGYELFSNKLGTSKFYSTYGFDLGYVKLKNESDSIGNREVRKTNYSGVYFSPDFFYRQYFNLPTSSRVARPFIDLGVAYRIPMYFRKNTMVQGLTISEKWLHNYNELVVYTRIGLSNGVALNASYRLFNSVKNDLPQLPQLQIGLTILADIW